MINIQNLTQIGQTIFSEAEETRHLVSQISHCLFLCKCQPLLVFNFCGILKII